MFEKFRDIGSDLMHHQLMNGGRKFACTLWRLYPDQWTKNKNLGTSLIESFWNNMCQELPPPKSPPFEGGQCAVVYDIYYREGDNPGQVPDLNNGRNVTSVRLQGPIVDISVRETENTAYLTVMNFAGVVREGEGFHRGSTYVRKVLLARADNRPDNCGNPPPVYPPTMPPQPGEESYDAPINNNDGTDFTVPLGWFDIDFNLPLTINVGPPQLDFTMEINVDGIDLNFGPDEEFPDGTPKPSGPGGEDKFSEDTFNNTEDTKEIVDDIEDTVNDIKDIVDKPPLNDEDYDENEQPSEDEAEETDRFIEFVRVDVLELPKKGKTIIMNNPADNVFFAGYFAWTVDGARSEEFPVRKSSNIYAKPTWADGYRFYTVNGARCRTLSFRRKLTNPDS